jgi:hypothetical protein
VIVRSEVGDNINFLRIILPMPREHHTLFTYIILNHPTVQISMARCLAFVKEVMSHFYIFSDWMLVMKGFSQLIENVCEKVEQLF